MKIAIIGVGFVGSAVARAFSNCQLLLVDPKLNTNIEQIVEFEPQYVFVCTPTPSNPDGSVNTSITEEATRYALLHTYATVIVKSTVPPSFTQKFVDRIVINPEFLTERNAIHDMLYAEKIILGGPRTLVNRVKHLYSAYSECVNRKFVKVSAADACWIKYITNSMLAVKVAYLNELYAAVGDTTSWRNIVRVISDDERLGNSHWLVPGPDNKFGFGGACLPKDTKALLHEAQNLDILDTVIKSNNKRREQYELDSREREQNITYDN